MWVVQRAKTMFKDLITPFEVRKGTEIQTEFKE